MFKYNHDRFVKIARSKGYIDRPTNPPTMIGRAGSCPVAIIVNGQYAILKCIVINPDPSIADLTAQIDSEMSSAWTEIDSDGDLEFRSTLNGLNSFDQLFEAVSQFEADVNKITELDGIYPVSWPDR